MDDEVPRPGVPDAPTRDLLARLIEFLWSWRWRLIAISLAVALLWSFAWFSSKTIVVTFDGAGAAERPLLLYSGVRDGVCRAFEPWVGSPSVTLADVKYSASCPTEIDVFARGHGADAYAADPGKPGSEAWFKDALASGTLKWSFPAPVVVPLTFWLVADDADLATVETTRDKQLTWALARFDAEGAGIALDAVSKPLAKTAVGNDCSSAADIALNSTVFDTGRINVYLVKSYGAAGTMPAYSCVDAGHKEIAFVAWGYAYLKDAALMHELGHALGLSRPHSVWGHTEGVAGFDNQNIMWPGASAKHITVGQLYAMHFSDASWLNGAGPSTVRPLARTCQDSWGVPPSCPQLAQAQSGWPPP